MSAYLERAEAEWDRMSLAERIEALDTGDNDLLGFVEWWKEKREAWLNGDTTVFVGWSLPGPTQAIEAYLRQHPRFAAWLDREAGRQQQLDEPDTDPND